MKKLITLLLIYSSFAVAAQTRELEEAKLSSEKTVRSSYRSLHVILKSTTTT